MNKMSGNEHHKKIAVEFLQYVIKGKIDEAYEKFVDLKGKHHNVFFPAGFPTLLKAMKDAHAQFPKKQFAIKKVLGDNNMVAVHSHLILQKGKDMVVVHMFRFNKNKIVEMWDCGQEIPANSPNTDGAF